MIRSAIENRTSPGMCGIETPMTLPPCSIWPSVSSTSVTIAAPITAPVTEARPPITSIASSANVESKKNSSGPNATNACAHNAPPAPMIAAESTQAPNRATGTLMPLAAAASGSSRVAWTCRPGLENR